MAGTPSAAGVDTKGEALAFKVMRLNRPSFHAPLVSSPAMILGDLDEVATADSASSLPLSLSGVLLFPPGFGNIYLGETFSAFICVSNNCQSNLSRIEVRADLQTGSKPRIPLVDINTVPGGCVTVAAGGVIAGLGPKQHIDYVVDHELKESGVHIMICTASYLDGGGEERKVRQYFKFQVQKPLSVTTKLHFMRDCLFLENQIQNVTKVPLHLDAVKFEPTIHYIREDLNNLGGDDQSAAPSTPSAAAAAAASDAAAAAGLLAAGLSDPSDAAAPGAGGGGVGGAVALPGAPLPFHGTRTLLRPGDVRQYLYRLTPRDGLLDPHDRRTEELGRLEMAWRSAMGEPGPGRLHSLISMQQWKLPPPVEVELSARAAPDVVRVGQPFEVEWRIYNKSDKVVRLTLELNMPPSAPIIPCGAADFAISEVLPKEIRCVRCGLVALEAGLRAVTSGDVTVVNCDTLSRHPLAQDLHILVE